jgi:hypothetical protein
MKAGTRGDAFGNARRGRVVASGNLGIAHLALARPTNRPLLL